MWWVAQAGGLLLDLVVCYCCALVGGVCCVVGGSCIYVEVWLGVFGFTFYGGSGTGDAATFWLCCYCTCLITLGWVCV